MRNLQGGMLHTRWNVDERAFRKKYVEKNYYLAETFGMNEMLFMFMVMWWYVSNKLCWVRKSCWVLYVECETTVTR